MNFWKIADEVKRRLFSRLRIETSQIDYHNYEAYRSRFESIPDRLIEEWRKIEKKYHRRKELNRLKGFLYEVLFYYACLRTQTVFLDAELCEIGGAKFGKAPPWFECIPLYDIIPNLHYVWRNSKKERKVPQIKADFLVTYVDDEGALPPALIDVKSSKNVAKYRKKELMWQIIAAMRLGFIFQAAYPKPDLESEYPRSLEDWEIKTPCPKCGELSDDCRECSKCGAKIFPFTIVDAHYKLKELIAWLKRLSNFNF